MPPVLHGVVGQTEGGKKDGHAKIKTWRRRPATNPSGYDNLLTEVCALLSWKYSLFWIQHGPSRKTQPIGLGEGFERLMKNLQ